MIQGQLILVSAPSGAGKTSLVSAALESDPKLVVAVSHTTREPRVGEHNGVNYHFVDHAKFSQMIAAEEFLEHADVFDNHYGTSRSEVSGKRENGQDVILEIDWQGAAQVRALLPDAVSIFILPPSIQALEDRLISRGQNTSESIQRRLSEASIEMASAVDFDYLIVNDEFDTALVQLLSVMRTGRQSTTIQTQRPEIKSLLGL
ncbi:MAG: guanylate kinase [Candidatus Azotimanducaceae bacterium]|jgi:guanylate kinase|tara:strand:+ start:558 stop:1169 length:612 start_codon:yes stop_codon:yes gene_type:complete